MNFNSYRIIVTQGRHDACKWFNLLVYIMVSRYSHWCDHVMDIAFHE